MLVALTEAGWHFSAAAESRVGFSLPCSPRAASFAKSFARARFERPCRRSKPQTRSEVAEH